MFNLRRYLVQTTWNSIGMGEVSVKIVREKVTETISRTNKLRGIADFSSTEVKLNKSIWEYYTFLHFVKVLVILAGFCSFHQFEHGTITPAKENPQSLGGDRQAWSSFSYPLFPFLFLTRDAKKFGYIIAIIICVEQSPFPWAQKLITEL